MKPDPEVLNQINSDLFRESAARVIYLEGKSDPDLFFGLLGIPQPPAGGAFIHKGTLAKGLSTTEGSGNTYVRRVVDVGHKNLPGKVFGIVDGDGESLATLASQFDAPHTGPLFTWKAYSIESLFAHLPWPATWGPTPNWQIELERYAPYVAMNRLHSRLRQILETLRLAKHLQPVTGQPMETALDAESALKRDKGLLLGVDVASEFGKEITEFTSALTRSIEEGLAMFNGKWLFRHFLVERLGKDPDHWTNEWIRHAESTGGLPAVRDLWQRITGSQP